MTTKINQTMIIVSKATRKKLIKAKVNRLESYDILINRLLEVKK